MPNTQRGREPLFSYDHDIERTLSNMNRNLGINEDDLNQNIPAPVDVHGQLLLDDTGENQQWGQKPAPRPQEYYRGYDNIVDFDRPLVLPPLPQRHTFVVTSSLMQMLTARGLFSGLPSEDPHAHIAKVREVCKSRLGRPDLDLDLIGLRVFPISLMGEAAIWFTELPYNSIFIWNQLRDVFLARYYPVSKKLNHKDRVNNFVALPGESISKFWDKFTLFLRSFPDHRIDDESLKEYFYRGQDDNNKAVLDTIAGGSYGECPYAKIAEKLEKISRNNNAWSTRKSNTGRNTFAVQPTHNPATNEIPEEMAQMRTEQGLVLKHVTGGAEKINSINYLSKPPPPNNECYNEEDSYAINEQTGSFRPSVQGSNQENWHQGQGNKGRICGKYNREGHYVRDENYNRDKNFNRGNYGNKNDRNGPYVPSLLKSVMCSSLASNLLIILCNTVQNPKMMDTVWNHYSGW